MQSMTSPDDRFIISANPALVTFTVDREWFVAILKNHRRGAVMYASPIQTLNAFDLRDFIFQARRQQDLSFGGDRSALTSGAKSAIGLLDRKYLVIEQHDALIFSQLQPAFHKQLGGRYALISHQTVRCGRSAVARVPVVVNKDASAAPTEHEAALRPAGPPPTMITS